MLSRVILGLGAVVTAATVAGAAPIILPAAIPNGDFQTGTLTGWTIGVSGTVTVVANAGPSGAGDYAVHTQNVADWNTAFYLNGLWDEVASIEGATNTTYNITFDVKAGNPAANSTLNLRVEKGHWNGYDDFIVAQSPLLSDGQWHTVTVPYTTGSDLPLNRFGIKVMGWTGAATHDFYFDNFAVSAAVPEPATIGLLGVATLGLLQRRQRRA